jgi:hypothetical protein
LVGNRARARGPPTDNIGQCCPLFREKACNSQQDSAPEPAAIIAGLGKLSIDCDVVVHPAPAGVVTKSAGAHPSVAGIDRPAKHSDSDAVSATSSGRSSRSGASRRRAANARRNNTTPPAGLNNGSQPVTTETTAVVQGHPPIGEVAGSDASHVSTVRRADSRAIPERIVEDVADADLAAAFCGMVVRSFSPEIVPEGSVLGLAEHCELTYNTPLPTREVLPAKRRQASRPANKRKAYVPPHMRIVGEGSWNPQTLREHQWVLEYNPNLLKAWQTAVTPIEPVSSEEHMDMVGMAVARHILPPDATLDIRLPSDQDFCRRASLWCKERLLPTCVTHHWAVSQLTRYPVTRAPSTWEGPVAWMCTVPHCRETARVCLEQAPYGVFARHWRVYVAEMREGALIRTSMEGPFTLSTKRRHM